MFCPKFYLPNFRNNPYLILIEKKLKEENTFNWNQEQFRKLLNLKGDAKKAGDSFSQLEELFADSPLVKNKELQNFEKEILKLVQYAIENQDISAHEDKVRNKFALIKTSMSENKGISASSAVCQIVGNSIIGLLSFAAVCLAVFIISTGPIVPIILGIGFALVSAALTLLAAYSIYMDGRYLADKQVKEIDSFLDSLFSYICPEPIQVYHNHASNDPTDLKPVYTRSGL